MRRYTKVNDSPQSAKLRGPRSICLHKVYSSSTHKKHELTTHKETLWKCKSHLKTIKSYYFIFPKVAMGWSNPASFSSQTPFVDQIHAAGRWRTEVWLDSLWIVVVVQLLNHVRLLQPHGLQHARLPCPLPSPRTYSNSCALSRWCHPTISSSVICFSSCLQSFPASRSFPVSQLFPSGGQSIAASASASVLLMNIQGWFLLGLTGWISLQSNGLSRVFNTTVQKHQFVSAQISL